MSFTTPHYCGKLIIQMQRITLDNFRVFGTEASFELAPVTVLTGKNNSGKSSLIKSFLVLADYLKQEDQTILRLDGQRAGKHRISDWENLKNWTSASREVLILGYTQGEVKLEFDFRRKSKLESKGELLLPYLYRFRMEIPGIDELVLKSEDGGQVYQLEVAQRFIDYLAGTPGEKANIREAAAYPERIRALEDQLEVLNNKLSLGIGDASQGNEFMQLLEQRQQLEVAIENLNSLVNQGQTGAGIFFAMDVAIKQLSTRPTISGIIQAALENYVLDNIPQDESYTHAEIIAEYGLEQDEDGKVDQEELEQAITDRNERLELERNNRKLNLSADQGMRTLNQFRAVIESLYLTVEHLGANRTHQARLYLVGDNNHSEINTVAENFQRLGSYAKGGAKAFLKKWLPRFDLGERVIIRPVENSAISIVIVRGKQQINLADLGFGAGQVLAILLQIAALIQRFESEPAKVANKSTLVLIEEPEANLHPHFQSQLSELFSEMAQSRYQLQFVLETHSEYLIRNIQVLVKNNGGNKFLRRTVEFGNQSAKIKEEVLTLFRVYYMDIPSEKTNWKYGYEMRLRDDGPFMDKFGDGFLDEARKLAFKVL